MTFNKILAVIFFFSLLTSSAQNQEHRKLYVALSYIKINPGKASTYMNLIKNYSPKITESRIRQGGVLGWYMYEVRTPSGAANEYDLVSITVVDDFKLMFDELAPPDDTMHKIFPGLTDQSINDIFAQYESSRTSLKKEIYILESEVIAENPASKYLWVDYINTPEVKEKELVKADGTSRDRAVLKKYLPYDSHSEFNQVTAIFSNDLSTFAWKAPSAEAGKLKNTSNNRTIRSEIWQLVEYVDVNKIKR